MPGIECTLRGRGAGARLRDAPARRERPGRAMGCGVIGPGVPESLGVLESVAAARPALRHVSIDEERLAAVCRPIGPDDLRLPAWEQPFFCREDADTLAGQIVLFNAINFCYWGEPKWQIDYAGQALDGSAGVLAAVRRALEEGMPLLDASFLAGLSEADFEYILRGRGRLHLMAERLGHWRQLGEIMEAGFGGWPANVIAAADGDALALVRLLVERFPSFDDCERLDGQLVRFYKRAQLTAAMLYEAFAGTVRATWRTLIA